MSFLRSFIENIRKYPHKVALEFIDPPLRRLPYSELGVLVDRTAGYLQSLGTARGDRIALQLAKSLEFILLHLAAIQLGCIVLPLNPAYPLDELKYFLEDSGAKWFFTLKTNAEKYQSMLTDLPDLQECVFLDPSMPEEFQRIIRDFTKQEFTEYLPDDTTALLIYTSGTTGRPKGAEITHGNMRANLQALHEAWDWQPDDVLLHVLPIFHIHGLSFALHGALHAGTTILFMREFNAQ